MKLCAIFSVWDDYDLLDQSTKHIDPLVDGIIVVASERSNHGEASPIPERWIDRCVVYEPVLLNILHCETAKRNHGLALAKSLGYTHFIMLDADEFYDPVELQKAKDQFDDPELLGLVVESQVYFKEPTLTIGKDVTLVPHIHKLTPDIKHEFNKKYPFAWDKFTIRIDPTRSLNINSGVKMFDCLMHHYSWVRSDYEKKIRNSTARANLERSTIREDLANAAPGYLCKFYQKELYEVDNKFGVFIKS